MATVFGYKEKALRNRPLDRHKFIVTYHKNIYVIYNAHVHSKIFITRIEVKIFRQISAHQFLRLCGRYHSKEDKLLRQKLFLI